MSPQPSGSLPTVTVGARFTAAAGGQLRSSSSPSHAAATAAPPRALTLKRMCACAGRAVIGGVWASLRRRSTPHPRWSQSRGCQPGGVVLLGFASPRSQCASLAHSVLWAVSLGGSRGRIGLVMLAVHGVPRLTLRPVLGPEASVAVRMMQLTRQSIRPSVWPTRERVCSQPRPGDGMLGSPHGVSRWGSHEGSDTTGRPPL